MTAVLTISSRSPEKTEQVGQMLAKYLHSGDILTLDGDLGAGKTALTRGIARGMGLTSHIASPTFTIVMEHPAEKEGQLSLFHFDVYRLTCGEDFLDCGLDEYFDQKGVSVLEWGKLIASVLPDGILRISMQGTDQVRTIEITFPESRKTELELLQKDLGGDLSAA